MKSLVYAVAAATALSASFGAFAQSTVTRAQVRNELVQLEQAGYKPSQASPHYPADILAAQARVNAQADNSGYGVQPAPVV
ncbi:purine-nucleoside phosphorylase, partial [Burkholderia multivorans]